MEMVLMGGVGAGSEDRGELLAGAAADGRTVRVKTGWPNCASAWGWTTRSIQSSTAATIGQLRLVVSLSGTFCPLPTAETLNGRSAPQAPGPSYSPIGRTSGPGTTAPEERQARSAWVRQAARFGPHQEPNSEHPPTEPATRQARTRYRTRFIPPK